MVTLVLLPGMDGSGGLFADIIAALPSKVPTVVISYPPDEPLDYAALELMVRARLPADGPYVLLGESFSGPIAVSIAASAPRGLRGLILCCSFVRSPRPSLRALRPMTGLVPVRGVATALFARALLGPSPSPRLRQALARVTARVTSETFRARLRAVLGVDVSAEMARVRVPALYLRATNDRVVPRAASLLIRRLSPAIRVIDVEAPHLLLQTAPAEAARAIGSFLSGL